MKLHGGILILLIGLVCNPALTSALTDGDERNEDEISRAVSWLLQNRNDDLHWGIGTPLVLLGLSRTPLWNASLPDFKVGVKQLDVDFLFNRLKHGDLEVYSDRLIPLTLTLTSLCRKPTNFYGYDLSVGLLDSRRVTTNLGFAQEVLTVCLAQGNIRKPQIRRMVRMLNPHVWNNRDEIDTMSMAIMAGDCLKTRLGFSTLLIKEVLNVLKMKQLANGSFDNNVVSTSLAIQAMQSEGLPEEINRARRAAIDWLRSAQWSDGSFGDLLSTTEALLALSPLKGRNQIGVNCIGEATKPELRIGSKNQAPHIVVHLVKWINSKPITDKHTINLNVPINTTVYEALERAASLDSSFTFEFKEYPFGRYITSINNVQEDDWMSERWVIYVLPEDHDNYELKDMGEEYFKQFLLKTSINSYKLKDGEFVLFWFKSAMRI